MPVPTKMSRRSVFSMKPNLYAGQAVTRNPSGTATIHATTRHYQWTLARGAGAAAGLAAGGTPGRPPLRRDGASAPLVSALPAFAATVADTAAVERTCASRVASSRAVLVERRGGGATGAGAPVRA